MVSSASFIHAVAERHRREKGFKLFVRNHQSCPYPRNIGFFKAMSIVNESEPKNYSSKKYVPITRRNIRSFLKNNPENISLHQRVENRSKHVAEVLSQGDLAVETALKYCLREMFRNIFEHSQTVFAWYGGQYWPSLDAVEFAFSDIGSGFLPTINRHPSYNVTNDFEALEYAMEPGVTGQPGKSNWSETSGPEWANSGYGLFIASELCRRHGRFHVHSNSAGRSLSGSDIIEYSCHFPGTLVVLELNPSTFENVDTKELIKSICKEGEERSALSPIVSIKRASKSSSSS